MVGKSKTLMVNRKKGAQNLAQYPGVSHKSSPGWEDFTDEKKFSGGCPGEM